MWKVFAIICIMEATGPGTVVENCQTFYEDNNAQYVTEEACMVQAKFKANQMFEGFNQMNIPYESMQFGCKLFE